MTERKLRKAKAPCKWIGGVCAGFAYWVGVPTWIVRLVLTILTLFYGIGLLPYILLWIFLPTWEESPADFNAVTGG